MKPLDVRTCGIIIITSISEAPYIPFMAVYSRHEAYIVL